MVQVSCDYCVVRVSRVKHHILVDRLPRGEEYLLKERERERERERETQQNLFYNYD